LVTHCDVTSITLWPTREGAEAAANELICGHACSRNHEIRGSGQWAGPESAQVEMPFGKYRGAPLWRLPKMYLQWLA
jgi:hypothetical protein